MQVGNERSVNVGTSPLQLVGRNSVVTHSLQNMRFFTPQLSPLVFFHLNLRGSCLHGLQAGGTQCQVSGGEAQAGRPGEQSRRGAQSGSGSRGKGGHLVHRPSRAAPREPETFLYLELTSGCTPSLRTNAFTDGK